LVVVTGAMLVLSACSGGSDEPKAAAVPTTTTAAPAPSSVPVAAESKDQSQPFVADTNPDVSSEREGYPVLVSLTQGDHAGYRRYVFTFAHADPEGQQPWRKDGRPPWNVRYVPASQAVMDGSGDPVANAGANAHLRIQFQADMHYADGSKSLEGSVTDAAPDLAFGGDLENQVNWFYGAEFHGAEKKRPFRGSYVGGGGLAVDIMR